MRGVGVEKDIEDTAGTETDTVGGCDEDFGRVDHTDWVACVMDFFDGGGDLDDVGPESAFGDEVGWVGLLC